MNKTTIFVLLKGKETNEDYEENFGRCGSNTE